MRNARCSLTCQVLTWLLQAASPAHLGEPEAQEATIHDKIWSVDGFVYRATTVWFYGEVWHTPTE